MVLSGANTYTGATTVSAGTLNIQNANGLGTTAAGTTVSSGATYIARGFSGEPNHMAELIAGGIAHRGFALIDVFSPCVTYNKVNTYPWFKQRVYKLEQDKGYDPHNVHQVLERAMEWGDRIPIGLFYKADQPTYEDSEPALKMGPLAHQPLGLDGTTFDAFVEEFY